MDIPSSQQNQSRIQPPVVDLSRDKNSSQVVDAVKPMNASASTPVVIANHTISFRSDDESGRDYFVIKDKSTDEVVKQYPPEEMIKMARYILKNGDIYNKEV